MKRAIELAYLGKGKVSPNPMVGCVIVREGKIIGEGWHQAYGGPHAEANAVNSIADKGSIQGSDVYVTLEPCAHHGKTPPCADLLADLKVKNVFIANLDINPLVKGKGIERLVQGRIHVELGLLENEGKILNKRFFTFHLKKRPYVILKWAQTSDRFIARSNYDSKWISNVYSRQLVHKWRAEEDGVVVGSATAIYDNPRLDIRDWKGDFRQPVRIAVDPDLKIPKDHALFDGSLKTIIYNLRKSGTDRNVQWIMLDKENFLQNILSDLHKNQIHSVMVEGGAFMLNSFIAADLWDEARIFTSNQTFGDGIKAPDLHHARLEEKMTIFEDDLHFFLNRHG